MSRFNVTLQNRYHILSLDPPPILTAPNPIKYDRSLTDRFERNGSTLISMEPPSNVQYVKVEANTPSYFKTCMAVYNSLSVDGNICHATANMETETL